jgi:hypothetical protein
MLILPVPVEFCREVVEKTGSKNRVLTNALAWKAGKKKEQLDISKLTLPERDMLRAVVDREADDWHSEWDKHCKTLQRKWDEWDSLLSSKAAGAKVDKLDLIPGAIMGYFSDLPHKWVFRAEDDGSFNPYFISKVEYKKAYMDDEVYIPAQVHLSLLAYKAGSKQSWSFTWYGKHLGKTVPELLATAKLSPETDEAVAKYREVYQRYQALQEETGKQMHAYGDATYESDSWYSQGETSMVRDGRPTKVVVDDAGDGDEDHDRNRGRYGRNTSSSPFVEDDYWKVIGNRNGMSAQDPEETDKFLAEIGSINRVYLPVHPYLRVFDLDKHRWTRIHTANLQEYPWDKGLIDKLVIDDGDKQLMQMLMSQTGARTEDIIRGKMAGVVVLATGLPGVGKTLTAEVFSEVIEKPLYTVQCSQLGLDVDDIEKNLKEILDLAGRWGAILLIDEADVYIRRRGEDITQNAIVGVFLRLIEYYKGVLFMTSNRGDMIDDAIISRATAWIRYQLPTPELLERIWVVLGEQYGAKFSKADLNRLVNLYQGISGRTVRNLLKLAKMLKGDNDKPVTLEDVAACGKYQALENDKGE